MRKLGLGLGLSRGGRGGTPPIITATLTPAMSRLYDGQAVQDVTNYSTMVSLGNFASSLGTIVSAPVTFQGAAASASDPLALDETAGFTVTPVDNADPINSRPFVAAPITVEYKVQFEEVTGNIANTDINDIVGDAVDLGSIVIAGADAYNATYTGITAGDLRDGPYNWGASNSAGLPSISGIPGETLTGDYGLWSTPDGTTLTLTPRWLVDDVLEAGETGITIDSSAYTGSDIKFAPQGSDGTNTLIATSAATSIPSGSGLTVLEVLEGDYTSGTGTITDTVPAGAASASKEVWLVLAYGRVGGTDTLTITLDGNVPDATAVAENTYAATTVRIYRWDVPAGGDLALSIAIDSTWAGVSYRAFTAINRTTTTPKSASSGTYGVLTLSNAVNAGARIIGAAAMGQNGTTGAFSYVGLTQDYYYANHNSSRDQAQFSATAGSTETRTMTVTPTGDGSGQVAAALVILE